MDKRLLALEGRRSSPLKIILLALLGWALMINEVFSFENFFLSILVLIAFVFRGSFNWHKFKGLPWRWFIVVGVFFVLFTIIPVFYYWPVSEAAEGHILKRAWAVMLVLFVFIAIYLMKPNQSDVWWALILTATSVLFIIVYEAILHGGVAAFNSHRFGAELVNHPISFGVFSNLLTVVLLGGFIWATSTNGVVRVPLLLLAIMITLMGTLLSNTRSAWIGFPEALIVWTIFYTYWLMNYANKKQKRIGTVIALAVSLVFSALFVAFYDRIETRVSQAFSDVDRYFEGKGWPGSVGTRLILYEVGIQGFTENPLTGVGLDNAREYQEELSAKISQEVYGKAFQTSYGHLHNQYIEEAYTRGIFALLGLSVTIVYLLYFFSQASRKSEYKRSDSTPWPIVGLVFVIANSLAMLTESTLSLASGISNFIYYSTLFVVLTHLKMQSPSNHDGL